MTAKRTLIKILQKNMVLNLGLVGLLISTSGCLVLRSQMDPNAPANPRKNRTVKRTSEVEKLEKQNAELQIKIKGYDEQFRTLLGRIEEMEGQVGDAQANSESDKKVKDLELALSQMVKEQEALKKQISSLKSQGSSSGNTSALSSSSGVKGDLDAADRYFSTGKWAKAIEEFQKFREINPKSPEVPLVTYKIGVCFQELNMVSEAKTFYNSVIRKYPQDKAAKFAKFRLDNL